MLLLKFRGILSPEQLTCREPVIVGLNSVKITSIWLFLDRQITIVITLKRATDTNI